MTAYDEHRVEEAATALLVALGLDLNHHDLIGTPNRMARMYVRELCGGLFEPCPTLTSFPKPPAMDQLITVGPVIVHSLCPHHFAPIIGHAWVGVLPGSRVLGLSKYARLIRWCAARPVIQEGLTEMVADHLAAALVDPLGIAVVIKARHLCMEWRGIREPAAYTTTSAVRGRFLTKPESRAEFMRFVQ